MSRNTHFNDNFKFKKIIEMAYWPNLNFCLYNEKHQSALISDNNQKFT